MNLSKIKRIANTDVLDQVRGEPCWACGLPSDPAHIHGVGAFGPDLLWNMALLCRIHHTEQHKCGWKKMWSKYPIVKAKMQQAGWYWLTELKLWNDKLQSLL